MADEERFAVRRPLETPRLRCFAGTGRERTPEERMRRGEVATVAGEPEAM